MNKSRCFLLIISFMCLPYQGTGAAEGFDPVDISPAGEFIHVEGDVSYQLPSEEGSYQAEPGTKFTEGANIMVGKESYCEVRLTDGSVLSINEESSFTPEKVRLLADVHPQKINIKLFFGSMKADVRKLKTDDSVFEIQTPVAVAGVRGTSFSVDYENEDESNISVYEGSVEASPLEEGKKGETVKLSQNNQARIQRNRLAELKKSLSDVQKNRWKHFKERKNFFIAGKKLRDKQEEIKKLRADLRGAKNKQDRRSILKNIRNEESKLKSFAKNLKQIQSNYKQYKTRYMSQRAKLRKMRGEFIKRNKDKIIKRFRAAREKFRNKFKNMPPEEKEKFLNKMKKFRNQRKKQIQNRLKNFKDSKKDRRRELLERQKKNKKHRERKRYRRHIRDK